MVYKDSKILPDTIRYGYPNIVSTEYSNEHGVQIDKNDDLSILISNKLVLNKCPMNSVFIIEELAYWRYSNVDVDRKFSMVTASPLNDTVYYFVIIELILSVEVLNL